MGLMIPMKAPEWRCSCGKTITQVRQDGDFVAWQHGGNPEHRLRVSGLELAAGAASVLWPRLTRWLEELHRYERAGWPKKGPQCKTERP